MKRLGTSQKKHKNRLKIGEHTSSGISNQKTSDLTPISTKRKGKQSLPLEHPSQQQEHPVLTNNKDLVDLKENSSDKNECFNEIAYSDIYPTNVLSQIDDFASCSPIEKDVLVKSLNGLKFNSPKSSSDSVLLKSSLETENVFASTSISPQMFSCSPLNSPESNSSSKKTCRKKDIKLNSLCLPDKSIISSSRHHILDVPIENPLDVTIEDPAEFNVCVVDDNNLAADIRYLPLNFDLKVEVQEIDANVGESTECNVNEEIHHPKESTIIEDSVEHKDNSHISDEMTIKPKNLKNICRYSSSRSCNLMGTNLNLTNINENNVLFEDLEIEIVNTSHSSDDKESSPNFNKRFILQNSNISMEPEESKSREHARKSTLRSRSFAVKKNDYNGLPLSLHDSTISEKTDTAKYEQLTLGLFEGISIVSGNESRIDALCMTPSSCSDSKNTALGSRRVGAKKIENPKLEIGKQSYSTDRTTLTLEDSPSFQTPSSNIYVRKSTLKSRSSVMDMNEDLEAKILNMCHSNNDIDTSISLNDITSPNNTKKCVEPKQLSRSFISANHINRTSEELEDNCLFQTPTSRKSTLRSHNSGINKKEEVESKNVKNHYSINGNDIYEALDNINSSNTDNGIEPALSRSFVNPNCREKTSLALKDDSLCLKPISRTLLRRSTLRSSTKKNDDPEVKIVKTCSGNDTDISVPSHYIASFSSIDNSIDSEKKDDENKNSLFVTPSSSNHSKKFTLTSTSSSVKINKEIDRTILDNALSLTSNSVECTRKGTLRSKSLEVKKSHNESELQNGHLQKKISSRSLSYIDQEVCSPGGNDKSESKRSINQKLLKIVVVPMANLISNGKCPNKIQQISSNFDGQKTTENNNLGEPKLPFNGIKINLQSNKVEQKCDKKITDTQNPELVRKDETCFKDINSPLKNYNCKKFVDKNSSDFISPRLKAKQLQQMGLIAEDTSFAFYSTVDSVLAEIRVSQKQHKMNSQGKKQFINEDDRTKENSDTPNVTKEQTMSVEIPNDDDTVTDNEDQLVDYAVMMSTECNKNMHEDTRITRNRKSRLLIQERDSNLQQNTDFMSTQGKLIFDQQNLYNDSVAPQNGLVHLENETNLDTVANNESAEGTESLQESSILQIDNGSLIKRKGRLSNSNVSSIERSENVIVLHEPEISQDSEVHSDTEIENIPIKIERGTTRKSESSSIALSEDVKHLQGTRKSSKIPDTVDNVSTKRKRNNCEISFGLSNDETILNEQDLSQKNEVIRTLKTHAASSIENIPKRRRGRPRKTICESNAHAASSIENIPKRRRGRPRKTICESNYEKVKFIPKHFHENSIEINNGVPKVGDECAMINSSLKGKMTRSRSQELSKMNDKSQLHIPNSTYHALVPPQEANVNTALKNLNSGDNKSMQTPKVKSLPTKEKSSRCRKSKKIRETQEENFHSLGINVLYSLDDKLKSPQQSDTAEKRRSGPKTAKCTIITQNLESKSSSDLSRLKIHSDLDSSAQIDTELKDLNNEDQKSKHPLKIEALPTKVKSRKSEVENVDLDGNNIPYSLDDRIKSPQSEKPEKRRSRSKTAECTIIPQSFVLESKSTSNLSRRQIDNNLNSSVRVNDEMNNSNDGDQKSIHPPIIETFPIEVKSGRPRKSESMTETEVESIDSVGINVPYSPDDRLKSPQQSETSVKRKGRSKLVESALITKNSELEPNGTSNLSIPQIDNDLNSSVQVNTETKNSTNEDQQSICPSKIDTLLFKEKSGEPRKSENMTETQVENIHPVGNNIPYDLDDRLKSPQQSETPEKRRGRSKTAECALINPNSDLESNGTLNVSIPQTDNDLNSSVQVNTETKNSNNEEQKSICPSKIDTLLFEEKSVETRKSENMTEIQVENIHPVGINVPYDLDDRLKAPQQSETPEKRRGRSKIAECTLINPNSDLESNGTSNGSIPQTDNDLNSSVQVNTETKNLNNGDRKSIHPYKIDTLPIEEKSGEHRKSEKSTETHMENADSVGIKVAYSLDDRLKSPQQSETPDKRRGQSETAECTLITPNCELESNSTSNLSRSQTGNDLNSSAGEASVVQYEKQVEQNNKQICGGSHEENFDSGIDLKNKAKSVEKWVEEHVQLVEAERKGICCYSPEAVVTNKKISKEKVQKDWTPRRSLTRGRKLVAMLYDDTKKTNMVRDMDTGEKNHYHEEAVQHSESMSDSVKTAEDSDKSNTQDEAEGNQNKPQTRDNSLVLEQPKLMENNTQNDNQEEQLENAQFISHSKDRYDTVTENERKEDETRSEDYFEENRLQSSRISHRRSCSVLREQEKSKEDSLDVTGYSRTSTSPDSSQMGVETDLNEKMVKHSPERHCRPKTSLGNRRKGSRSGSMNWSSRRRRRSNSKCPPGTDMSSYKHGDLIWAQIGSYPYWPCMVTYSPDTKEIRKTYFIGRGLRTAYHVQFFGDNGRRAWINVTKTMPFNSSNDLNAMVERLKVEEGGFNMFYQPFMFKSSREVINRRLQAAADEADSVKLKTLEEKLAFFEDTIKKVIEGSPSNTTQLSPKRSGKSKRSSQDLSTLPPSKVRKGTEICTVKSRRSVRIESKEDNETTKDEEEVTKDVSITPRPVKSALVIPPLEELYSIEAQKALFKRNNLFKGVSRDKVCHFCLEPGDVLRCSAKCSGIYHLECSDMVRYNKIGGKRQTSVKYSPYVKSEDGERPESDDMDHNHVQIVTVSSSIYHTPPRKNFPPDFDDLTLAEQIDYKMKEVMGKFESKNIYANDSQSASSDDNGSDKKVVIRHVAADSVIEELVNKVKKPSETNIAERFFAKPEVTNANGSFRMSNSSLVKRHVTADDVSFEAFPTDSKNFKCSFCLTDVEPNCFVCHERVSPRGSEVRQKCSLYHCGRFFHPSCLKMWPQTQWSIIQQSKSKNVSDSFVCPQHVCHTCVSDDPRAATSRCSCDKIVKCMLCPRSYHSSNLCIPAGTKILSTSQIICPGHRKRSNTLCINTTWCFLCSEGGNLICCENCPTSVHPECLPVNFTDDGKFICEDCETGRLLLYDEIVWVKLGHFRWWPAVILFPNEVPPNVNMVKHSTGDFVVRFFGTYNYYWVNRGRAFLFQDGDTGDGNNKVKKLDKEFKMAVEEATLAHKLKQEFKNTQQVESLNSQKPPPYIKIKVNKPVGNVRQLDLDLSNTTACNCDPNQANPCGPDSDCLNRLLMTECNPDVCPAGSRCRNQSFEKREYPPMMPYKTQARGWGLKTLMPIKKGQFVIEYVGEIIDAEEYQRRIQKMHEQKEENYYFLTIDNQRMIDAGPKGNLARFMNHCCQPNCETQKWTVNGETRVGLFATMDIPAETELTFNYNLECIGKEKKICRCGAPNCSGFIGAKAKQDDLAKPIKVAKRVYKKKAKLTKPVVFQPCFICNRTGSVITCNNKMCNKAYHIKCLKLDVDQFDANRFVCPWHNCEICSKRTIRCCVKCIRSYCPQHSDGKIRHASTVGYVCYKHDPMKRFSVRTKNIDIAEVQHTQSPTKAKKLNKEPINLNNKKQKKSKLNSPLRDKEALTDNSLTDSDDIPLSIKLKNIRSNNLRNHDSLKKRHSNEGISEMSCTAFSSVIKISKTPEPQPLQNEVPNVGVKSTSDYSLGQGHGRLQSSIKIKMEEPLATSGPKLEIYNTAVTTTKDEIETETERKTEEIEDPASPDLKFGGTPTEENLQDEASEIEDKKWRTKTKAQLKEYPTNLELENSSKVAACLPHKISEQMFHIQDDESLSKNQDGQTLSENFAAQEDSSKQNLVVTSPSKIGESGSSNDSICDASPIQDHEVEIETNVTRNINNEVDTSRLSNINTDRDNGIVDELAKNMDSISEIDADLSSKFFSDNCTTDDSQEEYEKLKTQKRRKRLSQRLNSRKRRR